MYYFLYKIIFILLISVLYYFEEADCNHFGFRISKILGRWTCDSELTQKLFYE
jgi:hypothetical protein